MMNGFNDVQGQGVDGSVTSLESRWDEGRGCRKFNEAPAR